MRTYSHWGDGSMDHPWHTWSPIIERPDVEFPGGANLSLSVVVKLQSVDWGRGGSDADGGFLAGGIGPRPSPNIPLLAHREYGFRVGLHRLLTHLAPVNVPLTFAVDVLTAQRYPGLIEDLQRYPGEFVAAGSHAGDLYTSALTEEEERESIREVKSVLDGLLFSKTEGWFGPEYSESATTVSALSDAGFRYLLEWVNDERPFAMDGVEPAMTAVPVTYELDDENAMWRRGVLVEQYAKMLRRAASEMNGNRAPSGRSLIVVLNPWLSGQPFRVRKVASALRSVVDDCRPWATTTGGLADYMA